MFITETKVMQKQTDNSFVLGNGLSVMSPAGGESNGSASSALSADSDTTKTKYDVLVVDDDDSFRSAFVDSLNDLTDLEMAIVEADSGESALAEMENDPNKFDIVFLDLTLPGINGATVEKHVRGLGFRNPIIVMSSDTKSTDAELARSRGLNVIDKNLIFNEIRDLLLSPWSN